MSQTDADRMKNYDNSYKTMWEEHRPRAAHKTAEGTERC